MVVAFGGLISKFFSYFQMQFDLFESSWCGSIFENFDKSFPMFQNFLLVERQLLSLTQPPEKTGKLPQKIMNIAPIV